MKRLNHFKCSSIGKGPADCNPPAPTSAERPAGRQSDRLIADQLRKTCFSGAACEKIEDGSGCFVHGLPWPLRMGVFLMSTDAISGAPMDWLPPPESVSSPECREVRGDGGATGVFTKSDRFHLINGILVAKNQPGYPPHAAACDTTHLALQSFLPAGWYIRVGKPLQLLAYVWAGELRSSNFASQNPYFSSVLTAAHPKSVVTSFYGTNFGIPGYLTLIPVNLS